MFDFSLFNHRFVYLKGPAPKQAPTMEADDSAETMEDYDAQIREATEAYQGKLKSLIGKKNQRLTNIIDKKVAAYNATKSVFEQMTAEAYSSERGIDYAKMKENPDAPFDLRYFTEEKQRALLPQKTPPRPVYAPPSQPKPQSRPKLQPIQKTAKPASSTTTEVTRPEAPKGRLQAWMGKKNQRLINIIDNKAAAYNATKPIWEQVTPETYAQNRGVDYAKMRQNPNGLFDAGYLIEGKSYLDDEFAGAAAETTAYTPPEPTKISPIKAPYKLPPEPSHLQEGFEGKPHIIGREEWGAEIPKNLGQTVRYSENLEDVLNYVVIHHSNDPHNRGPMWLQTIHMEEKDYDDIAYHFIIGEDGSIYEGRPLDVMGAHAGQTREANLLAKRIREAGGVESFTEAHKMDPDYGSIGIVLAGEFETGDPTEAQTKALNKLLAHLKGTYDISASHIIGHRHVADDISRAHGRNVDIETDCPGKRLTDEAIRDELPADTWRAHLKSAGTWWDTLFAKRAEPGTITQTEPTFVAPTQSPPPPPPEPQQPSAPAQVAKRPVQKERANLAPEMPPEEAMRYLTSALRGNKEFSYVHLLGKRGAERQKTVEQYARDLIDGARTAGIRVTKSNLTYLITIQEGESSFKVNPEKQGAEILQGLMDKMVDKIAELPGKTRAEAAADVEELLKDPVIKSKYDKFALKLVACKTELDLYNWAQTVLREPELEALIDAMKDKLWYVPDIMIDREMAKYKRKLESKPASFGAYQVNVDILIHNAEADMARVRSHPEWSSFVKNGRINRDLLIRSMVQDPNAAHVLPENVANSFVLAYYVKPVIEGNDIDGDGSLQLADIPYAAADHHAGLYASRNTAVQKALNKKIGTHLALDGDICNYDANGDPDVDNPSNTMRALIDYAEQLEGDGKLQGDPETLVKEFVSLSRSPEFTSHPLYAMIFPEEQQIARKLPSGAKRGKEEAKLAGHSAKGGADDYANWMKGKYVANAAY